MDITPRRNRVYEGHCNWEGCGAEGSNRLEDAHGVIWAHLCGEHVGKWAKVMARAGIPGQSAAEREQNVAEIMQFYVKTLGGVKAAGRYLFEQQKEALRKSVIRENGTLIN